MLCYSLGHVQLFADPWTVPRQAPLSLEFSRQEYWSRWPFPSLGDLSDPGIEPASPGLLGFLLSEPPGKPGPVEIQPALPSLRVLLLLCFCPAPAILTIPPRIQLFYFISWAVSGVFFSKLMACVLLHESPSVLHKHLRRELNLR